MSVLHTKYNSGDQIKKTEMGGACNTNGGERERGAYRVVVRKLEGRGE